MSKRNKDRISFSLKLTPVGQTDQPLSVNATTLNLAQGVAYIDFGFIDPNVIVALTRDAKADKPTPKTIEGKLVVRVSMPSEALLSFRDQIDRVLKDIREDEKIGAKKVEVKKVGQG